jgi:eukaryotic-like serine/threonine-protein kinase
VAVVDFDTGEVRVLVEGAGCPRYVDGHILFGRDGILYASPIDVERLELLRAPAPVLEGVAMWSTPGVAKSGGGEVQYDVAKDGTLLYSPRESRLPQRTLMLVDRAGRRVWSSQSKRAYSRPFFSPDGRRIALSVGTNDGSREAFVVDVQRDAWTRVGGERDLSPRGWMPDGRHLLFASGSRGPRLLLAALDRDEPAKTLYLGRMVTASAAPDGSRILFSAPHPVGDIGLWRLALTGDGKEEPWVAMPGEQYSVSFSPDGRFVVYGSTESGREETFVRAYSSLAGPRQISTQGGDLPRWSRDGKEIFFRHRGSLWSAAVRTSPKLDSDPPRKLFDLDGIVLDFNFYDVSPDGQLFAVVEADPWELRPLDLVVVPGFVEEMESRLAATR